MECKTWPYDRDLSFKFKTGDVLQYSPSCFANTKSSFNNISQTRMMKNKYFII